MSRASPHSIDSPGSNIAGETAKKLYGIGDGRAFAKKNKRAGHPLYCRLLKGAEALSYMPALSLQPCIDSIALPSTTGTNTWAGA